MRKGRITQAWYNGVMQTRTKVTSLLLLVGLFLILLWVYPGEGSWQDRIWWGLETMDQWLATQEGPEATLQPAAASLEPWWQAYFTDPTCPPPEQRQDGLDVQVAQDILAAQQGVDMAMFDLEVPTVVDALIQLEREGKRVRVVTESDHEDQRSIRRLRRHGVSVVTDKRRGFMHNKFLIIDDGVVWTGSMNLTSNGVYCNHNNFVRFDSVPQLVANYRSEMDEMYERRLFGTKSPRNTPYERFTFQNAQIQNIFAPETSAVPQIARTLATAQEEIAIMAFSFTSRTLGETVLGRAQAGVLVRALFEEMGAENETSYFVRLQRDHYPNVVVKKATDTGIMHHKVILIDHRVVIFGSYNFTDSADKRNDENVLIIEDPGLAQAFEAEFETLWAAGELGVFQ